MNELPFPTTVTNRPLGVEQGCGEYLVERSLWLRKGGGSSKPWRTMKGCSSMESREDVVVEGID